MFVNAYEKACKFTRPVVISMRMFDGTVEASCATYIVLNKDGWFLTAAHILNPFFIAQEHKKEVQIYHDQVKAIEENPSLKSKKKREKINKISRNPKWIINHSYLWGIKEESASNFLLLPGTDIALGKFDKAIDVEEYPVFVNPSKMKMGRSLCRLGFPLYQISASFDEEKKGFILAENTFPLPFFPIDGIYTREINIESDISGKKQTSKYIETSSPGLKGQSGGPIFDVEGNIWGIQSFTNHYPLGFSPILEKNGKQIEENQFLNVGLGVHAEVIIEFLKKNKIEFTLSK